MPYRVGQRKVHIDGILDTRHKYLFLKHFTYFYIFFCPLTSSMTHWPVFFSKILFVYKEFYDYNNNNNNNPRTIFIVLSSWPLKVIVRVHSVHLMNAVQRTSYGTYLRRRLECVIQQQGGDIEYMIWRPQKIMTVSRQRNLVIECSCPI